MLTTGEPVKIQRNRWHNSIQRVKYVGLTTLLKEVLTVGEGVHGWRFKICDFGNVFAHICRTSGNTVKWMAPLDLAHRIGLSTLLKEVLTADEEVRGRGFKICVFGNVFAYDWKTSKDTAKWIIPFDSAHKIGLDTLLKEVLTVGEGVYGW